MTQPADPRITHFQLFSRMAERASVDLAALTRDRRLSPGDVESLVDRCTWCRDAAGCRHLLAHGGDLPAWCMNYDALKDLEDAG
jgi:hypothetical protein